MSPTLGFTTWFWQTIADLSADLDSDAAIPEMRFR